MFSHIRTQLWRSVNIVASPSEFDKPVGSSFLGLGLFLGFSSVVRQMSGSFKPLSSPTITWPSLTSILTHYGRQWPVMLTRPNTLNMHTYIYIHSLRERVYIHNTYMKSRKTCSETRKFRIKFPGRLVPNPCTIRWQAKRFKETGSANNRNFNRRCHYLTE